MKLKVAGKLNEHLAVNNYIKKKKKKENGIVKIFKSTRKLI